MVDSPIKETEVMQPDGKPSIQVEGLSTNQLMAADTALKSKGYDSGFVINTQAGKAHLVIHNMDQKTFDEKVKGAMDPAALEAAGKEHLNGKPALSGVAHTSSAPSVGNGHTATGTPAPHAANHSAPDSQAKIAQSGTGTGTVAPAKAAAANGQGSDGKDADGKDDIASNIMKDIQNKDGAQLLADIASLVFKHSTAPMTTVADNSHPAPTAVGGQSGPSNTRTV